MRWAAATAAAHAAAQSGCVGVGRPACARPARFSYPGIRWRADQGVVHRGVIAAVGASMSGADDTDRVELQPKTDPVAESIDRRRDVGCAGAEFDAVSSVGAWRVRGCERRPWQPRPGTEHLRRSGRFTAVEGGNGTMPRRRRDTAPPRPTAAVDTRGRRAPAAGGQTRTAADEPGHATHGVSVATVNTTERVVRGSHRDRRARVMAWKAMPRPPPPGKAQGDVGSLMIAWGRS